MSLEVLEVLYGFSSHEANTRDILAEYFKEYVYIKTIEKLDLFIKMTKLDQSDRCKIRMRDSRRILDMFFGRIRKSEYFLPEVGLDSEHLSEN